MCFRTIGIIRFTPSDGSLPPDAAREARGPNAEHRKPISMQPLGPVPSLCRWRRMPAEGAVPILRLRSIAIGSSELPRKSSPAVEKQTLWGSSRQLKQDTNPHATSDAMGEVRSPLAAGPAQVEPAAPIAWIHHFSARAAPDHHADRKRGGKGITARRAVVSWRACGVGLGPSIRGRGYLSSDVLSRHQVSLDHCSRI